MLEISAIRPFHELFAYGKGGLIKIRANARKLDDYLVLSADYRMRIMPEKRRFARKIGIRMIMGALVFITTERMYRGMRLQLISSIRGGVPGGWGGARWMQGSTGQFG